MCQRSLFAANGNRSEQIEVEKDRYATPIGKVPNQQLNEGIEGTRHERLSHRLVNVSELKDDEK